MPPPPSSSSPRLALPAMTRSQADHDLPSLISNLTSLLLHSPAASSGAAGPIFSSSSLSIPTVPKPTPSTPSPTRPAFTYTVLLPIDVIKTCLQAAAAPSTTS